MGKIIRNGIVFGGGSSDWTGKSANVNTAIDNGEITEGMTVNITDDSADSTLFDDIKEYVDSKSNNVLTSLEAVNASTSDKDVVGAAAVKELNNNLEKKIPFSFGITASGEYGYKKVGADTVYPFKSDSHGYYVDLIVNDKGQGYAAQAILVVDGVEIYTIGSTGLTANTTTIRTKTYFLDKKKHTIQMKLKIINYGQGCKITAKLYQDNVELETIGSPYGWIASNITFTSNIYNSI